MKHIAFFAALGLAACNAGPNSDVHALSAAPAVQPALFPGETPQMRALIVKYAAVHDIPEPLLHAVIQRESDYRADARNGMRAAI